VALKRTQLKEKQAKAEARMGRSRKTRADKDTKQAPHQKK